MNDLPAGRKAWDSVRGAYQAYIAALRVTIDALNAIAVLLILAALLITTSAGALFLLPRRGASAVPYGPETPAGPRWELAGLAQLPGTHLTAVQTA